MLGNHKDPRNFQNSGTIHAVGSSVDGGMPLPELLTYLGKESNRLEEVEAGLGHDPDDVYTEYADPGRDAWRALVLPVLKRMPARELATAAGLSERSVKAIRNGYTTPRPGRRAQLVRAAGDFARAQRGEQGVRSHADDLAACAAYLAAVIR